MSFLKIGDRVYAIAPTRNLTSLHWPTNCFTSGRAVAQWLGETSHPEGGQHQEGETKMLWTIFVILLVLWLLGLVTSYTMGGFIHVLLVVAIAVLLIQVITGRRVV